MDAACKVHDIAYANSKNTESRNIADKELQNEAFKRVFAKDATFGERTTALAVTAAMKAKRMMSKVGGKLRNKTKTKKKKKKKETTKKSKPKSITFQHMIKNAKIAIRNSKPDNVHSAIKVAVDSIKNSKQKKEVKSPRVIKVPSFSGGVLPLIPIFAGLSALGTIAGSTTGILKAINEYKNAQTQLKESQRHNQQMESIAMGKGYYLRRSKQGSGFYLKRQSKNK